MLGGRLVSGRRSDPRRAGIIAGVPLAIFLGLFGLAFLLSSHLSNSFLMLLVEVGFAVSAVLFVTLRRIYQAPTLASRDWRAETAATWRRRR